MRPASIVNFERVVLLLVLFHAATAAFEWERIIAEVRRQGIGQGPVIVILAGLLALILLLMWLIARRRSAVAKWIYVALTLLLIASTIPSLSRIVEQGALAIALNAAFAILSLVSVWLLFRPDARAWLGAWDDRPAVTDA